MAINTDIQTFTDAELLTLTRKAIADILVGGQATGANGRQLTRTDLPKLTEAVEWLEARVNSADPTSPGGIVLGVYGERQ
jgi:hypothetical protein